MKDYMQQALEAYIAGNTAQALQIVDEAEGEYQFDELALAELADYFGTCTSIDTRNSPA